MLLGTYTATSTITVSDVDVSHYLAVCDTSKSARTADYWVSSDNASGSGTYNPPTLSISDNIMTIVPAKLNVSGYLTSTSAVITTKIYYVGEIS